MRHIISILLENESGALSRMTLVTRGSDDIIEQITKQLHKLVEVVKLSDLTEGRHIEREMMLIKVKAVGDSREEVGRLVDIFRGRVIDVTDTTYAIELTGTGEKLDAFLEAIRGVGIIEVARSGVSGIARGEKALRV
jgi:acetolactate synthase-1/3 small subunit